MTDTKGSEVQHDTLEVDTKAKPKTGKKTTTSSSKTTKSSSAAKAAAPKKASATKKTTKTTAAKKTAASKDTDAQESTEKGASKKSAATSAKTSSKATAKSSEGTAAGTAEKKSSPAKKATSKKAASASTKTATAAKKTTKTSTSSASKTASSSKAAVGKASPSSVNVGDGAESPAASAGEKTTAQGPSEGASAKSTAPSAKATSSKKTAAKTTKTAVGKTAAKSTKTASTETAAPKVTKKTTQSTATERADESAKESQTVVGVLEGSKSLPLEGSKAKSLPVGEEHAALAGQAQKALQEDKKAALSGSAAKSLSGTSKALPAGDNAEKTEEKTSGAKKSSTPKSTRKAASKTTAKSSKTTKAKQEKVAEKKVASSAESVKDSSTGEVSTSEKNHESQGQAASPQDASSADTSTRGASAGEELSGEGADTATQATVSPEVGGEEAPQKADTAEIMEEASEVAAGEATKPQGRKPTKKAPSKAALQKDSKDTAEKQADAVDEETQPEKRGKGSSKAESKKSQPAPRTQRRKMFVSVMPEEQIEVVITEEGQVQEYYVEMLQQQKTKGNIYKATIHNVDANLQAAFVNYGANKNGFLQIDEVHPEYYNVPHDEKSGRRFPPIQKVLKPGQELLVQVVKEPNASKGAFLTTYLSLAGRFLVLTPGREQIGVSRKVDDGSERGRLREMLEDFKPGPGLGVIVRTVSMGMNKATLKKDLQSLKTTWKKVRTLGTEEVAPKLIYEEIGLATRSVRDYLTDQIAEVWLDDPETAKDVDELASTLFPKKSKLVHVHTDFSISLFERFNLQRQLDQIQSREVPLPSGGRLVIDTTEALTAIDINSGRSGGKSNFEDTAFRTNMEAAKMIPLQLRLRDIGGQVVCDFIEMRDKSHWREVEKTVRASMKIDRARHDVGRISSFGLLELVRQRLGSSAISVNMEVCPHCKGSGVRRNMEWQSQQALKDIVRKMRAAKEQKQSCISYGVDVALAMHLLNSKRQRLNHLEEQLGVTVEITLAEQE